jgi:hypothetical protein
MNLTAEIAKIAERMDFYIRQRNERQKNENQGFKIYSPAHAGLRISDFAAQWSNVIRFDQCFCRKGTQRRQDNNTLKRL